MIIIALLSLHLVTLIIFCFRDYKPLENGGYWQEQIPMTDNPVCAALDPAADFRWHPLNCGGPEVASFICQLEGRKVISLCGDEFYLCCLCVNVLSVLDIQSDLLLISSCLSHLIGYIIVNNKVAYLEIFRKINCLKFFTVYTTGEF